MPSPLEILVTPLGWALRHRRSGERYSVISRPGWSAAETISVSSESFDEGGTIDDRHSAIGRGQNLSPHLMWSDLPLATRELVLVVEDLDPARYLVTAPTIMRFASSHSTTSSTEPHR